MYLLFLPFLFLILIVEEARWRVAAMRVVVAVVGFFAVILPWSAYVTQETGQAMLVTANGGETLGGGLNPRLLDIGTRGDFAYGDRTVWTGPGKWLPIYETGYLTPAELKLPYAQQDKLLTARTIDWVKSHPVEVIQIEAAKVGYMWGVYGIERSGWRQALFGSLPTIALLVLAIGLTALQPVQGFVLARFWLLPAFVTAIALISWGSWRFRMPGDAGLIAYSAILGVRLFAQRTRARLATA